MSRLLVHTKCLYILSWYFGYLRNSAEVVLIRPSKSYIKFIFLWFHRPWTLSTIGVRNRIRGCDHEDGKIHCNSLFGVVWSTSHHRVEKWKIIKQRLNKGGCLVLDFKTLRASFKRADSNSVRASKMPPPPTHWHPKNNKFSWFPWTDSFQPSSGAHSSSGPDAFFPFPFPFPFRSRIHRGVRRAPIPGWIRRYALSHSGQRCFGNKSLTTLLSSTSPSGQAHIVLLPAPSPEW